VRRRDRLIEHNSRARSVGQVGRTSSRIRLSIDEPLLDGILKIQTLCAQVLENVHDERVVLGQKAEQQMLGANLFVAAELRFFARLDQGAAQSISEIVPYQMILPREDPKLSPTGQYCKAEL
jgi:hypothetical protein